MKTLLLVWGPSRHTSELQDFCHAELLNAFRRIQVYERTQEKLEILSTCITKKMVVSRIGSTCMDALTDACELCSLLRFVVQVEAADRRLDGVLHAFSQTGNRNNAVHLAFNMDAGASTQQNKRLLQQACSVNQRACSHLDTSGEKSALFLMQSVYMIGSILYENQLWRDSSGVVGLGPTALDKIRCRVSLSLANVSRGDLILDPCCGSGSIPVVAAEDFQCRVVFSDVDPSSVILAQENLNRHPSCGFPNVSMVQCDGFVYRSGIFDSIITDIPYGYRETISGPSSEDDMIKQLSELSANVLRNDGGRLVVWTHNISAKTLANIQNEGLNLVHSLEEKRAGSIKRRLLVWELDGRPSQQVGSAVSRRPASVKKLDECPSSNSIIPPNIWKASWKGDVDAIKQYFEDIYDANAVNSTNDMGATLLLYAAGYGKTRVVEILLLHGADPNVKDHSKGMNALHRASARGHADIIRLLLGSAAEVEARSLCGQTALHYAAQFGHLVSLQVLFESVTANIVDAVDKSGKSPLHLACQWGMHECALYLLENGASVSRPTECASRLTPAHLACRWGHDQTLQVLKQFGADLRTKSAHGLTPLEEAKRWKRQMNG
jgi:ankyrin repeat protein/predicted RNA methylase